MLRVDHERWGQTRADLRHLALSAAHARSRERFLALHDIAEGACATQVAERTGRHPQTIVPIFSPVALYTGACSNLLVRNVWSAITAAFAGDRGRQ